MAFAATDEEDELAKLLRDPMDLDRVLELAEQVLAHRRSIRS